jgi:hypothetical protein
MKKKVNRILSAALTTLVLLTPGPIRARAADENTVNENGLIVHYDMSHEGTTLINKAGQSLNGTLVNINDSNFSTFGNTTTLNLNGNGYISLPSGIITDETMTISATVATTAYNNQWLWTFGKDSWDYTFFTPSNSSKKTKFTIAHQDSHTSTGAWAAEGPNNILVDSIGLDGKYITYTVVVNNNITELYINGTKVADGNKQFNLMNIIPTTGTIGYIGKSLYSGDPLFKGNLADFKIYSEALTAEQIKDAAADEYVGYIKADAAKAMLGTNASTDKVSANLSFPAKVDGISMTWGTPSDTSVIAADGKVTAPVVGSKNIIVPLSFSYNNQSYNENLQLTVIAVNSVIAEYDMTHANGKLTDKTGHGFDASYVGFTDTDFIQDGSINVLNFANNKNKYVKIPKGIIADETFTIQTKFQTSTKAAHWLWTLGTKSGTWPNVNNYVFLNPMQNNTSGNIRAGLKDAAIEKLFSPSASIDTSKYNTITTVFEAGKATMYLNGALVSTLQHGFSVQDILTNGTNPADDFIGYLGLSLYTPDAGFTGKLANFKVYNYALTADEINYASDATKVAQAKEEINIKNKDDIRGNITLPEKASNGAVIKWTTDHPEIVSVESKLATAKNYENDVIPGGVVNRPAVDTKVKMTATVSYGTESGTKDIEINVKAAAPAISEDDYTDYFFSYFAGEAYADGEQIYFASSRDGLNWADLNGNSPVLTSTLGEKGVRDPFIIRSPEGDRFYMIATDLKIYGGSGWGAAQTAGSKSLMVWESTDLVNWSNQRMVKVARDDAGCTWAPEATYDEATGEYVVYWASKVGEDNYSKQRVYYAKTRDFYTFTEPQIYIEKDNHVIDTTIIKHNNTYYRFSKNETVKCVVEDSVPTLLHSTATDISAPLLESQGGVEGPTIFKLNKDDTNGKDKWCLLVDNYGGIGYYPLLTEDLASGVFTKPESGTYKMPSRARHGTPIRITKAEYEAVQKAYTFAENNEPEQISPIFESNSENDFTGLTLKGNASKTTIDDKYGNILNLDGTSGTYAEFNRAAINFDGRNKFTISMDVKSEMTNENFFTLAIGKDNSKYLYSRIRQNSLYTSITKASWNSEQGCTYNSSIPFKSRWVNLTIVLDHDKMQTYIDGVMVAEKTGITTFVSDYGSNVLAYLGKSFYSGDNYFKGSYGNIKIFNRALSEMEVARNAGVTNLALVKGASAEGLSISTKKIDNETHTLNLYVSKNNTTADITKIPLQLDLVSGTTASDNGTIVNLNDTLTYTVKGDGMTDQIWTVKTTVVNNPVLSGQYADPDIDVFDGEFYIYPTTDGFSGWSGTQFHAFSSSDMVNWNDHGVILDVATEQVPWAVGSAWAPTIEKKNGKYYFYFCAKRSDGVSAIGVAVSDRPDGGFKAMDTPLITPEIAKNEGISMGQTIDPSIFTDDNGKSYLLFGNGNAAIVELNEDMTNFVPGTMKNLVGATDFRESITVIKRDGLYHFTWSCDDTGSENYRVNYGTSASLYGPITYKYTVLSKDTSKDILGTGHQSFVQIPGKDEYYIAYHRFVTPLGQYSSGLGYHRETCIDKVEFGEDGMMKTITPTLEGITTPVIINEDNAIKSIEITTVPAKTTYEMGETLDTKGMVVTAEYSDGSSKTITEGYSLSGFDSETAGTKAVTVTYEGKTATFEVTVKEKPAPVINLTGIEVTAPAKKTYEIGETLDTKGIVVTAKYSDGSSKEITEGYGLSGFESEAAGNKTVTVTYEGKTATFEVIVKESPQNTGTTNTKVENPKTGDNGSMAQIPVVAVIVIFMILLAYSVKKTYTYKKRVEKL